MWLLIQKHRITELLVSLMEPSMSMPAFPLGSAAVGFHMHGSHECRGRYHYNKSMCKNGFYDKSVVEFIAKDLFPMPPPPSPFPPN